MPDPAKPDVAQQELESVRSENFIEVYANSAQLDVGPWDFILTFGKIKRTKGAPIIEQKVAVVMSPQHAKAMIGILATNLQEYEKQIGAINLPKPAIAQSQQASKAPIPAANKTQ